MLSAPPLTREALQQLDRNPPVFVVLEGLKVLGALDGIPNRDRVPAIAAWIDTRYTQRQQIGRYVVALPYSSSRAAGAGSAERPRSWAIAARSFR